MTGAVAVIGAGVSGLAAAYRLRRRGVAVTVYEPSSRTGGVIRSERLDGYLVEHGPNALQESATLGAALFDELGLAADRVVANAAARRRYIVRGGRLHPLPDSPVALLGSRLFPAATKLRLLCEPFIAPGNVAEEESLGAFARRRLGDGVLRYAVDPVAVGMFAGDPERLSVRHAFPQLYALERLHGSLGRALWRSLKRRGAGRPAIFSFSGGVQALTDALAARLADQVRLNSPVVGLRQMGTGWAVTALDGGGPCTEQFDGVVYAAPLHALAGVGLATHLDLGPLAAVDHPPLSVLALGFRREAVRHRLDGFGLLVPAVEPYRVLGTLFSSTLFPGRAPEGHLLLTTFVGGARDPELARAPLDTLLAATLRDLRSLLGVVGEPTFVRHICLEQSLPQYAPGYGRVKSALDQLEQAHPGLSLAGSYRQGIAVGDALRSGTEAADRIASALSSAAALRVLE